jgi:hypothetical protein
MWLEQYKELKRFINANPSITITDSTVTIPGDVRTEFYRHFDALRAGFVKDRFLIDLDRAETLKQAYGAVSAAVQQEMHLESIETSNNLKWFLLDPLNGLMRTLFDPVFNLLKGRLDVNSFGVAAETTVKNVFQPLFAEGYQRWATLALMHQMSATRLWTGKASSSTDNMMTKRGVFAAVRDATPPPIAESRELTLSGIPSSSFLMPEMIVFAEKLQGYAGFAHPVNMSYLKVNALNKKLDWLSQKQLKNDFGMSDFWPDMMLYISDEKADDIKVLADTDHIARPAAILEFMEEENWCYEKKVSSIIRHNRIFSPPAGRYIISRSDVSPETFKQLCPQENIHLINAGYDVAALEPVAAALAQILAAGKEGDKEEPESGETQVG